LFFEHRIDVFNFKANTDDRILLFAGAILDVGRGKDRPIWQEFHARVAAVMALVTVQEFYPVLAGFAQANIVVGTYCSVISCVDGNLSPGINSLF
jgi:hypothetical protein